MTPDQMLEITQKQLGAYNSRDIQKFCECFHDEIKVIDIFTGEISLEGIEAFKKRYGDMFASSPDLHCNLKHRVVLSETVVDEEWVTGSSRFPNGIHAVAVYGFRDSKIDKVTFAK
jgi:hypothetical protein